MDIPYSGTYWDEYYGGSYESTFQYGFTPKMILDDCWGSTFDSPPASFADIGCGPGQTLEAVRTLLPTASVYGVEVQRIPPERCVSENIIFGDFVKIHSKLEPVDLLYVACGMYVPWDEMEEFLTACVTLTNRAVFFANVYLEDKRHIPEDSLRKSIYRSRAGFGEYMKSLGLLKPLGRHDFFLKP